MAPAIAIDPRTNALLITIFGIEVVGVVLSALLGWLPLGCPVDGPRAASALIAACLTLAPAILAVKRSSGAFGAFISRRLISEDPLAKLRIRRKFSDQVWQLAIHLSMTLLEVYVLFYDNGGEPWLTDYMSLMTPVPWFQQNTKLSVHVLYCAQMAIWIVTCASHCFVEERHKDYVLMATHHVVTIALLWLSYVCNYVRIGTVVLLLHDSSDIVVDLLKAANYLKLEGPRRCFLVEITFILNFFTWGYTRLYLFGYYVVWKGGLYGPREICTAPGVAGMESFTAAAGSSYTRGHAPGASLGDGSFDWLANLRALPTHDNLPFYWTLNSLMAALLVMQVLWYLLFWRMLFRLMKSSANDVGKEEYEGDSDDGDHND